MTKEKIDEAAAVYEAHLGPGLFNYDGMLELDEHLRNSLPVEQ